MEFKQITLTNFLSYYGENTVDFSDTTTVLLGQNTSGKSKFFDSLNWVLFEKIYNTDIYSWVLDKKEVERLVPNKRFIKESIENKKDEMETSVRLVITDGIYDILIVRSYYYTFIDNRVSLSTKGLSWREVNELGETVAEDYDAKAELRISEKFPMEIRDFFLFQGEAASQILKLHKGSKFTSAVKKIANLENFELAKKIADSFFTTSKNIIKRNANVSKKLQEEQEGLESKINDLKDKLQKYESDFQKAEKTKSEYQTKINEANDFLSSQKDFEDSFAKKQELEQRQKDTVRIANTLKDEALEIADSWVFFKINDKLQTFKDFYKVLEKKGKVPAPIQQHEILQALNECKCPICETEFTKDSSIWKIIESKKTRNDTDALGKELQQLNYSIANVVTEIANVPGAIQNYYERTTRVTEERTRLNDAIKSLETQIANIRVTETNQETKKQIQEAKEKLKNSENALRKVEDDYHRAKYNIENAKAEISKYENQSLKLATSTNKNISEDDKIQLYYADQLFKAMNKLVASANDLAFSEIEKMANEYYKEMTKQNPSFVGELKIDFEASDIYTQNSNGQRIHNINQANRISIQLAVIAGILTVANNQFGEQYPFITDAPISDLGGNNKIPTIKCMVNAFEQSILILKDDATKETIQNDEVRKLIQKDKNIGIAYELIVESNEDVDMQYTKIKKIKG